MASVHVLARRALDERWLPMSKATTIAEMDSIIDDSYCPFCRRMIEIVGLGGLCQDAKCPLSDPEGILSCAHGLYVEWLYECRYGNFTEAQQKASEICELLQNLLNEPDYDW